MTYVLPLDAEAGPEARSSRRRPPPRPDRPSLDTGGPLRRGDAGAPASAPDATRATGPVGPVEALAEAPADVPAELAGTAPAPSFETFYAARRRELGRAVAFAVGDADLAAEATDEAFVRAYERWEAIARGNPAGWVYRVAINWSLSIRRRRRVARKHLYAVRPEELTVAEPAVHEALAALDPKHRSVVVCRHLLGWSVEETADALGIKAGTVKSRLSRATRTLQAHLHHLRPDQEQP